MVSSTETVEVTDELTVAYTALYRSIPPIRERIVAIADSRDANARLLAGLRPKEDESEASFRSRANVLRNMVANANARIIKLTQIERKLGARIGDPACELRMIAAIDGVLGIEIAPGEIRVMAQITYRIGTVTFDLGMWLITVHVMSGSLCTDELRPGYHMFSLPPVYRIGDGFCFGGNHHQIQELAESRFYYEAISLAISHMGAINPGDEHLVPGHFNVLGETSAD